MRSEPSEPVPHARPPDDGQTGLVLAYRTPADDRRGPSGIDVLFGGVALALAGGFAAALVGTAVFVLPAARPRPDDVPAWVCVMGLLLVAAAFSVATARYYLSGRHRQTMRGGWRDRPKPGTRWFMG